MMISFYDEINCEINYNSDFLFNLALGSSKD